LVAAAAFDKRASLVKGLPGNVVVPKEPSKIRNLGRIWEGFGKDSDQSWGDPNEFVCILCFSKPQRQLPYVVSHQIATTCLLDLLVAICPRYSPHSCWLQYPLVNVYSLRTWTWPSRNSGFSN
jgi:hypothetical protein